MLELCDVSKHLGQEMHLDSVSLRLAPGMFNVVLGETLAGKTTLMRMMAGLEKPGEGTVFWNGADVTRMPVRKRNVAMVHQQFVNYPGMTVFENIASPLRASGRPPPDLQQKVGRVAEILGISELLERLPSQLSGGQQQRTAIARALVKDADLVLLDEPLANLDYKLREELRETLPDLFSNRGSVVAYATTDPEEALTLGGHTAIMHEGRLVNFGPTADCYRQPKTLLEARVFADPPLNEITMACSGGMLRNKDGLAFAAAGNLADLPENRSLTVAFHAHNLLLRKPDADDAETFAGEVMLTELTGSESFVHVHVHGCDWVAQAPLSADLADSVRMNLHLRRSSLMVFDEDEKLLRAPATVRRINGTAS